MWISYKEVVLAAELISFLLPMWVTDRAPTTMRVTGIMQAVHFLTVQFPMVQEGSGNLTLVKLIANGAGQRC